MADNFKIGASLALDGEAEFKKAISDVNKDLTVLGSEMGKVTAEFYDNAKSMDSLTAKSEVYNKQIAEQKNKIVLLNTALEDAKTQYGENSNQVKDWQIKLNNAEKQLAKTESQLKQNDAALENYNRSQIEAARNTDEYKASQDRLGKAFDVVKIAALAVAASIVALTAKALESADEMQALSDKTGLTAERLQELQYIGSNLGVELTTITGAQAKLTKSMAAAEKGTGSQAEAFAKLGINVTDANGNLRSAQTVMTEAFGALQGTANETERNALAMAIFGKSAMELNPLISAGADGLKALSDEAGTSGAVMSNEAVAGLDSFGDSMENVRSALVGKFGEAFAQFAPQLTDLSTEVKAIDFAPIMTGFTWVIDNGKIITKVIVGITAAFVACKVAVLAATAATEIHNAILVASALASGGLTAATTALTAATGSKTAAILVASTAMLAHNIATAAMSVAHGVASAAIGIATAAQWAFNAALTANPIGVVIVALGLLGAAIYAIVKYWDQVTAAIEKAWNWLKKWNNASSATKNSATSANSYTSTLKNLQGYASGTSFATPGVHWVGENGPELVNFKGGENVLNATDSAKIAALVNGISTAVGSASQTGGTYIINLQVGEKTLAQVLFDPLREVATQRGVAIA